MQRDGLLGDVEMLGKVRNRAGIVANESQDRPPVRLSKGLQRRVRRHRRHCAVGDDILTSRHLYKFSLVDTLRSNPGGPAREARMASFRYTIDVAATPEQVWEVLGDVTSVDQWIPGVVAVTRTGSGRLCSFDDGHTQDEEILDYSPHTRSYRYRIEGAPLPVTDNAGTFAVEDIDGHARVIWQSSFTALDPAMESQLAQMWEPYLPLVLTNLKNIVESR